MVTSFHKKLVILTLAVAIPIVLLVGGAALAQVSTASTEPRGEPAEYLPPSYDSANPADQASGRRPPDENPTDSPDSQEATFSYYQVAGATLRGRNSTTGYLYDGSGCSHVTAGTGTGRILNTELPLPDGSVIKYLRVYYQDTNPANGVEGYITRYQPGAGTSDLVHTGSTDAFVGGYGFVVSGEITETVNNTVYAYTVIGWPDDANVNNQICGLRVAYYAPTVANLFIPVAKH